MYFLKVENDASNGFKAVLELTWAALGQRLLVFGHFFLLVGCNVDEEPLIFVIVVTFT
jgi:hypothetical protein